MQQDSSQKTVIIATLSFILGFGLAWLIAVNKNGTPVSEGSENDNEITELTSSEDSILVTDQSEGVRVSLSSVVLKEGGWAVIHEDDNGAPGRILGAQLLAAGKWTDSTVELLRGTLAGQTYYAMLHSDNGDRAFDPKKDLPITDDEGNPVVMEFKANASAAQE